MRRADAGVGQLKVQQVLQEGNDDMALLNQSRGQVLELAEKVLVDQENDQRWRSPFGRSQREVRLRQRTYLGVGAAPLAGQ